MNYLVSPFNSTDRFLEGEYFLTQQQENASNIIACHLLTQTEPGFISVTGGAGTGKSLLVYHIAKIALAAKKKVLIIHCGILNAGHTTLINNGWEIVPIRRYENYKVSDFDLIIIDEAQRLHLNQFKLIAQEIRKSTTSCIFSFDKLQTLSVEEDKFDIESQVSELNPSSSHSLSEKIRSNKEIGDFINMLFNKSKNYQMKGG